MYCTRLTCKINTIPLSNFKLIHQISGGNAIKSSLYFTENCDKKVVKKYNGGKTENLGSQFIQRV